MRWKAYRVGELGGLSKIQGWVCRAEVAQLVLQGGNWSAITGVIDDHNILDIQSIMSLGEPLQQEIVGDVWTFCKSVEEGK